MFQHLGNVSQVVLKLKVRFATLTERYMPLWPMAIFMCQASPLQAPRIVNSKAHLRTTGSAESSTSFSMMLKSEMRQVSVNPAVRHLASDVWTEVAPVAIIRRRRRVEA